MTFINSSEHLETVAEWLCALPLFAELAKADIERLAQDSEIREIAPGDRLFDEGETAHSYHLVLRGHVEVLRFGFDGEDRVFNIFGTGRLVAIAAMFMDHGRYPMSARSQDGTTCLSLARAPLNALCLDNPAMAMRMLRLMSATIYQHVNEVEWLTSSSAPQRLALYMLRLSREPVETIQFPLSQRQVASRLGVRAETLNRLLSEWQSLGHVVGRGREWTVHNRGFLQQLANGAARPF